MVGFVVAEQKARGVCLIKVQVVESIPCSGDGHGISIRSTIIRGWSANVRKYAAESKFISRHSCPSNRGSLVCKMAVGGACAGSSAGHRSCITGLIPDAEQQCRHTRIQSELALRRRASQASYALAILMLHTSPTHATQSGQLRAHQNMQRFKGGVSIRLSLLTNWSPYGCSGPGEQPLPYHHRRYYGAWWGQIVMAPGYRRIHIAAGTRPCQEAERLTASRSELVG